MKSNVVVSIFLSFFTIVQAEKLYADHLIQNHFKNLNFINVKAGTFIKGSPIAENGRYGEDQFQVILSSDFQMQAMELTQMDWFLVTGENPSAFSGKGFCAESYVEKNELGICPYLPVDSVSFYEVEAFIKKLNSIDHQFSYRLPTEAEWEFAARAGTTSAFYFGDNVSDLPKYSWYFQNSNEFPHKIGTKLPNAWGFYDMAGNVYEWVSDWYAFSSPKSPQKDPIGANEGVNKVLKGGSWYSYPLLSRSASRNYRDPNTSAPYVGFRLVRKKIKEEAIYAY